MLVGLRRPACVLARLGVDARGNFTRLSKVVVRQFNPLGSGMRPNQEFHFASAKTSFVR